MSDESLDEKRTHDMAVTSPSSGTSVQFAHDGRTVLVPQPSKDPEDPLNWSRWRKGVQFAVIVFAGFIAVASPTANQLAYVVQAETYGKEAVELSYGASASLAGMVAGPFLLNPLGLIVGRPAILFWGLLLEMVTQIWAAEMTDPNQYISFIISRLFSGLFGSMAPVVGTGFIIEAFFLHQRGRLFAIYEVAFLFGVVFSPTVGGFIIERQNLGWPWTFWWTVPVLGASALSVFLFVEDTSYDRVSGTTPRPRPNNWLAGRFRLFFAGWTVVPRVSASTVLSRASRPFVIAFAPVTLIPGLFNFLAFGFAIMVNLLMSIYLQTPEALGGYGFTPERNAFFTFTSWVSALSAWSVSLLLGDRWPLMLARRRHGGVWQPEYRLVNMLWPALLAPIGLGIIGATLEYHLHYMLLALGNFLVSFSAQICVPVCINYVVECFIAEPVDVAVALNAWRLAFGLALPFFAFPWEERVGAGWEFGMAAFFVLFSSILVGGVALWGVRIRMSRLMAAWRGGSEGGVEIAVASTGSDARGDDKA